MERLMTDNIEVSDFAILEQVEEKREVQASNWSRIVRHFNFKCRAFQIFME